ncbi:hypothetical protein V6Z11_D06G237500 [Gossypium hirsutum]
MESKHLWQLISFYLSTTLALLRHLVLHILTLNQSPFIIKFMDLILSVYFRLCNLTPCAVDLDDQTTIHFWVTNHRRFDRPSLVMIHGYGGNPLWQFVYQAKCLSDGLKRIGVDRFSVYAISYGGFVAYRMAEIRPDAVEKVAIVSSGLSFTDEQRDQQLRTIGRHPSEILVPKKPDDLRLLVNLSTFKQSTLKWVPDFLLRQFITLMYDHCRKEKIELADYLVKKKADPNLHVLTQETLIIWGDQDKVFPLELAYNLQRHLGKNSRLEIIKNVGHAANLESPDELNKLIFSFVIGCS